MSKTARSIATSIPRAAEREAAAVTRSSPASRVRVVHIASVVHASGVTSVFVGISIKLKYVLRTTAVDMTRPNLKVAEACWHDGRASWLSRVVEIDSDVVRGPVTKTR